MTELRAKIQDYRSNKMTELQAKIKLQLQQLNWGEEGYSRVILEHLGYQYTGRFKLVEFMERQYGAHAFDIYNSKYYEYNSMIALGYNVQKGNVCYRYLLYNWKRR
ncbi:hypothetical protein ES705_43539 [subsurface metagenome]